MLLLSAVLALVVAAPATAKTTTVTITKLGFVPNSVTIQTGDQVTWQNTDTASHQVVSQQAGFASPILKTGESYTFTFAKVGKFSYVDSQTKNMKGTVTVQAAPEAVTLNVAPSVTTYGNKVTLTGTLSSQSSGQTVDILAQSCSKASQPAQKIGTATTTTGGAFTFSAQPLENTTYSVRSKSSTSPTVLVKVKPRLRLGKIAPHRYTIRVFASQSFAGHIVVLQRYNALTHVWVRVRTAVLRLGSGAVAPTVISSVTITATVKARTRLRVAITQSQVGSCYLPGFSNAILA